MATPRHAPDARQGQPTLDLARYRARLQALETELDQKITRGVGTARDTTDDQADSIDQSVVEELRDDYFTLAQTDSEILTQVKAALQRIEDGTFGRCVIDGGPIDAARLDAVPWTRYCAKHQQELEAGTRLPKG